MDLLTTIRQQFFPIIVVHQDLQPIGGSQLLRRISRQSPDTHRILITEKAGADTGSAEVCHAREDISGQNFLTLIDTAVIALHNHRRDNPAQPATKLIGQCSAIKQLTKYAARIAQSDRPILIGGETGTGKDLLARQIHQLSPRRQKTLQMVNCAAISPDLFESEFFGHIKGAFTGANQDRQGHFSLANEGTLVLDEISELDIRFQVKLLRAIENQEIFPVGSQKVLKLNTRIIALSNRNLQEEISKGRFRADLYHRLNSFQLILPPLRERNSDIRLLADHFFGQSWLSLLDNWKSLVDERVYQILDQLHYSGNIRDLQNLITKVLSRKAPTSPEIRETDLYPSLPPDALRQINGSSGEENLNQFLRRMERSRIYEELHRNDFNITRTARQLGLSRQSLQHRLRRHQFEG